MPDAPNQYRATVAAEQFNAGSEIWLLRVDQWLKCEAASQEERAARLDAVVAQAKAKLREMWG
jgi:hypothetical protein